MHACQVLFLVSTLAITHSSRSCKAFGLLLHYCIASTAAWLLVDAHHLHGTLHHLQHTVPRPRADPRTDGGWTWTLVQYAGFATVLVGVCPIAISATAAADTAGGHQYGKHRTSDLCWIDFEDRTLYTVTALPLIALAVATAAMHAATVHASFKDSDVPSRSSKRRPLWALWARVPFYLAVSVAFGMLYLRQFGTSSGQQHTFAVLNIVAAVWFAVFTRR